MSLPKPESPSFSPVTFWYLIFILKYNHTIGEMELRVYDLHTWFHTQFWLVHHISDIYNISSVLEIMFFFEKGYIFFSISSLNV